MTASRISTSLMSQGWNAGLPRIVKSLPSIAILALVIAGALAIFITTTAWDRDRDEAEFLRLAESQVAAIEAELLVNLGVVVSLRNLVIAHGSADRDTFGTFAERAIDGHQSIQALEWVPVVSGSERPAYEAAARADGFTDFQFLEIGEGQTLRPAATRDRYFPVYVVEPLEGNERALGLDLGSNPARLAALTASVETASLIATAPITLVQENEDKPGFLVFVPVFAQGASIATPAARWEALQGFALGVFRAPDIFASALANHGAEQSHIAVADVTGAAAEPLALSASPIDETPAPFSTEATFTVGGRFWRMEVRPSEAFLSNRDTSLRWLVLAGSLALAFSLFVAYTRYTMKLADDLRLTKGELETAFEIAEILGHPGDSQTVFNDAMALLGDTLGVRRVGLRVVTGKGDLQLVTQHGPDQKYPIGYLETDPTSTVVRAFHEKRTIIENDRLPSRSSGLKVGAGNRSTASIPLLDGDTCVGVLYVGSERPGAFTPEKVRVVDFAAQALAPFVRDAQRRAEVDLIKTQLISVVSHELRTPLTALRASLRMLQNGPLGTLDEEGKWMLDVAADASNRLIKLVSDMLDLERIRAGKYTIETESHNSRSLFEAVEVDWRIAMTEAQMHLDIIGEDVDVVCDYGATIQVLSNLVSNAIKFSPAGAHIRMSVESTGGEATFTVSDEGRGIPPEKLESVFDRFNQVDPSDSRDKGGSGLGLAIVKELVGKMGGRIWIESELDQGSAFRFTLPVASEQDQAA